MQYEWINNVAKISSDYTIIEFNREFNQKIEPNTLPEKLTTLTFGYSFNQKIEPNILPEKITNLEFGWRFNQKIEPNTLPKNLTTLIFGGFNQKIEPNILPENLTTLTFGRIFNQNINSEILPSNLKNINFNWLYFNENEPIEHHIEMVNNIPNYYHVKIFLGRNISGIDEIKWPIHVVNYRENEWPPEIYEIQDKYIHPFHGSITILINKKTYQPYSSAKSALK